MSLELIAAVYIGALKCPSCGEPIKETDNYKADIKSFPQIGGTPVTFIRGETVTLKCSKCSWSQTTSNWRSFIK
jgi:hypothetical protein